MMNAREAAALLGGQATGPNSLVCPGPGHSARDRSLSIRFDPVAPDGFTCHSFSGDDWASCRDHVRVALGLGLWRDRQPEPPKPKAPADDDLGAWALRLWGEAPQAKGTLAETYLRGRGLEMDDRARQAIRFHPSCPFGKGVRLPCMIALFRDLRTDKPVAIQRTALTPEGAKIGRKMAGPVAGAAVKLDPDDAVTTGLVVSEGIETAIAGRMLGYKPAWALGSADAIGRLPLLGGIEALTVLGENDDRGANAKAAEACARRWIAAGAEVSVLEPLGGAGDANDVLLERAR
jgi:hypothetical protein